MESVEHKCDTCKKTFNRKERLEKHLVQGCSATTCKICNRKFKKVRIRKIHEKSHTSKAKRKCDTCSKQFPLIRDLQRHKKNAKRQECDVCNKPFCHKFELECHKRTEHVGGGIDDVDLNQPIYPRTGYEDDEKYKEEIDAHWEKIRDYKKEGEFDIELNKTLNPDCTYEDLNNLIKDIALELKHAFKINIGFGFVLRKVVTGEYRYFYVSSNNLLFDRAYKISKIEDIYEMMKHIESMNLSENYYMKRLSSGWVLAGIANVLIKIFFLKNVLLG